MTTTQRSSPIAAGFHPDPSVVLVDGVYYLVNSTMEYLPALPVHRSTDLLEWTHIGNVVTRPEQVDLGDVPTPGGVWAPTIRYRDGVFYVIVTVALGGRGCVVFTATDPSGPWSDGLSLRAVDGIDPDLAWDDDGTAIVTYARYPHAIQQVRVDLATGEALEQPRPLWVGSGLSTPESPHLYRRGGYWYLLAAEGGTERGHAVTVARSSSPEGPWEGCPSNPVLTAAGTRRPVQNTGHGDLVETPDGGTALILLGVRPVGFTQAFSPLGRETFLTDVDWVDGWPRPRPVLLAGGPARQEAVFDFADPAALDDPGWIAVRRTPAEVASLDGATGRLCLAGDGAGLDARRPVFLGRRQRHLSATVTARVDATVGVGGLAARHDERHWFALEVRTEGSAAVVTARAALSGFERTWEATLPAGEVELAIELRQPSRDIRAMWTGGDHIRLCAAASGRRVVLAELDGRYWSFETANSFTGRVIGLYATEGMVTFADYAYSGTDQLPDADDGPSAAERSEEVA
ncbi:glycoside hydrolase family 43 protein [Petropleomorpha daqingensis]|uniref:Beta-xylosidase n=1 Tax=Petropleomorpha daqingensis TaxID=2026353 RepID=A0A853CHC8_9ACTN|nr:beta-xylosidase [Petropleomorpha daqingensis]